jgi:heme/copper-type cytochrome/quinol oxidase subunit 2
MINLASFTNLIAYTTIYNDAAQPWQLGFQDSAAPGYTGIVTLHNTIGFYLIIISITVFWALFSIVYYFNSSKNPISHKYLTHGTVLELIWTITPAIILIAIAFPSFRLLYLMDNLGLFHDLALTNLANFVIVIPLSKIVSRSTEVVRFGVTGASNNIRLNKHSRDITVFNYEIISQLVGPLLGDG